MTKIPTPFSFAVVLIGWVVLFSGAPAPATAQEGKSESKTENDSSYGNGGKKITTYSDHDDKHFVEKRYLDAKGNLRATKSEVSDSNGTVQVLEQYGVDGKITGRIRKELDTSGNEVRGQDEIYKDGILVAGWRYDRGPPESGGFFRSYHYTHRFNKDTGQWEKAEAKKIDTSNFYNLGTWHGKPTIGRLISGGAVKIQTTGTGETIGHIADVTVENVSNQSLDFYFPPAVLESKSGKNQDYAAPQGQDVALKEGETKTIPVNGTCLERDKPPVGQGVPNDLIINDGDPVASNFDSHFSPEQARDLSRTCESKYEAVDQLQKDGELKDFPYKDKEKQKDILVQWSTWTDPLISEITNSPPATKDDLKKVVYKQVEEHGPLKREAKRKIDQGIDTIFEKIELTSEKAKDLEKPAAEFATAGTEGSGNTVEISDRTGETEGSPPPSTQEKKKEKKPKQPKPIRDWIEKKKAANEADREKKVVHDYYTREKEKFFGKNKHHGELVEKIKQTQGVLSSPLNQNSKEQNDKLIKERDEAKKELAKLEGELEKDFNQTDDGKKAFKELTEAEKAANNAHDAEKEAGKNIDPAVKDEIEKAGTFEPVPAVW